MKRTCNGCKARSLNMDNGLVCCYFNHADPDPDDIVPKEECPKPKSMVKFYELVPKYYSEEK